MKRENLILYAIALATGAGLAIAIPIAVNNYRDDEKQAAQEAQLGEREHPPKMSIVTSETHAVRRGKAQQTADEVVPQMIGAGLVRMDSNARYAWVDPAFWAYTDAQGKENLAIALALYVSPDNPMVTIYDKQSGKEIPSYGRFQGFRVK